MPAVPPFTAVGRRFDAQVGQPKGDAALGQSLFGIPAVDRAHHLGFFRGPLRSAPRPLCSGIRTACCGSAVCLAAPLRACPPLSPCSMIFACSSLPAQPRTNCRRLSFGAPIKRFSNQFQLVAALLQLLGEDGEVDWVSAQAVGRVADYRRERALPRQPPEVIEVRPPSVVPGQSSAKTSSGARCSPAFRRGHGTRRVDTRLVPSSRCRLVLARQQIAAYVGRICDSSGRCRLSMQVSSEAALRVS